MYTLRHLTIFITLILTVTPFTSHTLSLNPTNIETRVFGNQDASPTWQQKVRTALHDFGVPNTDTVPIKQINAQSPHWVQQFSSFTWHGIWVNEQKLNKKNDAEQTFAAYHEAAHYALGHANKMISYSSAGLMLALPLAYVCSIFKHPKKILGTSWTFQVSNPEILYLFAIASPIFILDHLSNKYELQADIAAAKKLYELGKHDIVRQYTLTLLEAAEPASLFFPASQKSAYAIIEAVKMVDRSKNLSENDSIK